MQHLMGATRQQDRVKWVELLDKLTIAGHSHRTSDELYTEISDHMPLLKDVSHHLCPLNLLLIHHHHYIYTVSQKKEATKLWAVTLSNLNRF